MTSFLLAASALTAAVLAIMLLPLLRAGRAGRGIDRAAVNARLLADELAALERERPALDGAEYQSARDEISRRLLDDAAPVTQRMRSGSAAPTLVALALTVPICGALLYVLMGTPGALGGGAAAASAAAQAGAPTTQRQVRKMVDALAAKLAAHPDDASGWAMLGRSYGVLCEFDKAAAAYSRIGAPLQHNAAWLAEYADALAMTANGSPLGRPEQLARQALAIDPNNLLALMLAGYAAAQHGDDHGALPLLEHAQREVTPGSEDAAFLANVLAQVRRRMGLATAADATAAPTTDSANGLASPAASPAAAMPLVHVRVAVAPALRAAAAGRTLFVIVRVPGQRMPVAALRRTGVELPVQLSLSNADSMDPSHPLSGVSRMQVEARLSVSGDAMPASGDLLGTGEVARGGSVAITIDHRRP